MKEKTRNKYPERVRQYYLENQESIKTSKRKDNYRRRGLAIEEAEYLFHNNNGCEICGRKENIHIDHNHETKQIRGVLCNRCNLGLGLFKDNIASLAKAISYLYEKNS